jgi:hypothetical protein
MMCTACGGSPTDESWKKGPLKLRYTGQGEKPYVAVCERCGCDVDYSPRMSAASSSRVSMLGRLAVGTGGERGLFQP